ncbi:MAG: phosphoribosylaminoimidazolesuccinocarboxamide synthase [Chloroflexi bacterium]|nr:phosphoribosylaminoimidazolesuccinocarboxamide synthase [Chloroflexota bacterium]
MTTILKTDLPGLLHRGKVRDTYDMGDKLLMVSTDRISAFDMVLPNGIPGKGRILSLLSVFWFEKTVHLVPNHFIAMAGDTAALGTIADSPPVKGLSDDIAQRAMVVRKARRIDVECIVRGYITGSAWSEYKRSGTVGDMPMTPGLKECQEFSEPLFTPTTKADTGHDENMTFQQMQTLVGDDLAADLREKSIQLYEYARGLAAEKGIIIADTKMEFGIIDGEVTLIDELLTPDSSRFWDAERYQVGQPQPNFDKQFVRDWLLASGWNKEPPAPALPSDIVAKTAERYAEAYLRLTGQSV